MSTVVCPDRSTLEQLLLGKLPPSEQEALSEHLLRCDSCAICADTIVAEDEVTKALLAKRVLGGDEEILSRVIARGKALRSDQPTILPEGTLVVSSDEYVSQSRVPSGANVSQAEIDFLAPAQLPDEIGRLGEYRILQVLGAGGMGVVFRAEDPRLKRQVALKAMKPAVAASTSAKERFLREAQFTAALEHDNIVHIYQVGEDRGVPFIAMQFLRGESLKARLERVGRLPEADVVRIGKEVAAGLAAAHKRGLIHRDIKPDNIWLESETDRVKILDFGLVRATDDDAGLTQSGMVMGTPRYMAPEQAQGHTVDHRCDLFSLGSVLYHLATGRPPFAGNNLTATLMAVVQQAAQPFAGMDVEISSELESVILRLLSKERAQRPQSAAEVCAKFTELERVLCQPRDRNDATLELQKTSEFPPTIPPTGVTAVPPTRREGNGHHWTPQKLALAGGGVAALLLAGVIMITITNKDGSQTKLEVPGDAAQIEISQDGKPLVKVTPGTGQTQPVGAARTPAVPANPAMADAGPPHVRWPLDPTPRAEMEGLLKLPGETRLTLRTGPKDDVEVSTVEQLPAGPATIVGIFHRSSSKPIPGDALVQRFAALTDLEALNIGAPDPHAPCGITGIGVEAIRGVKHLRSLLLSAPFAHATSADSFLALFEQAPWPSLTELRLGYCFLPPAQKFFPYITAFPNVRTLWMHRCVGLVDDAELPLLAKAPRLTQLDCNDMAVTPAGLQAFVALRPWCQAGCFVGEEHVVLKPTANPPWDDATKPPPPAVAPFRAEQALAHQAAWAKHLGAPVEYTNSIGMKFLLIPPGEFTMGSTAEEIAAALKDVGEDKHWQECIKSEAPQHRVILTQPIYLGVHEVTQAEYEKVMGVNPSHFAPMGMGKEAVAGLETAEHPVEMVSWIDAAEFCAKLSQQEKLKPFYFRAGETITPLEGTGYRLPSEAEWEFACRAGTATKYWIGDQDEDLLRAGWFSENSGSRTHAAGELTANPFGLSDMHGNVWEWVQDGWDATYYGQFQDKPAINPIGPFTAGSRRVIRGGNWRYAASGCRSSGRNADDPTGRYGTVGFRVSLVVDAVRRSRVAGEAKPLAYLTPGFDQWMKDVQALSAEQQVEAVSKKLVELNPGFDGKVTPTISEGVVTEIEFFTDNVADISPVRAFTGLSGLHCPGRADGKGGKLSDLSPLRGLPLKALNIHFNRVADLAPLQGMPLTHLFSAGTRVADLSPLQGMPLTHLQIEHTQVSDLSPLRGLPLTILNISSTTDSDLAPLRGLPLTWLELYATPISDLSPLQGTKLTYLDLRGTPVVDLSPLKEMPLQHLHLEFDPHRDTSPLRSIKTLETINEKPAADFYKAEEDYQVAAKRPLAFEAPGFEQWVKETAALPAEEQAKAVAKKLVELNPGFDGKVTGGAGTDKPVIENGVVKSFVILADNVTDISPLRALEGLSGLGIYGSTDGKGQLLNLSPLRGLPLTGLWIYNTQVSDLSPLQGMPLTLLHCQSTLVSDLAPLAGMNLETLNCFNTQVHDISTLKGMPLTSLVVTESPVYDLSPLQGLSLSALSIGIHPVNLSPLRGMPLKRLDNAAIYSSSERDLEVLRSFKTLETINDKPVAEFWTVVEEQQKGK